MMLNKKSEISDIFSAARLKDSAKIALATMLGYSGLRALYGMGRSIKDEYFSLPELPKKIVVEKKRLQPLGAEKDKLDPMAVEKRSSPTFGDAIWGGAAGTVGVLGGMSLMNYLEQADDQIEFANKISEVDRLYTEKVRRKLQKQLNPDAQMKIASCYIDGIREGVKAGLEKTSSMDKEALPKWWPEFLGGGVSPPFLTQTEEAVSEGVSPLWLWPTAIGVGIPAGFYGGYLAAKESLPVMSEEDMLKDEADELVGPELSFVSPSARWLPKTSSDNSTLEKSAGNPISWLGDFLMPGAGSGMSLDPSTKLALAGLTTLGLANILYKGNKMLRYNLSDSKKYGALPNGILNLTEEDYEDRINNA